MIIQLEGNSEQAAFASAYDKLAKAKSKVRNALRVYRNARELALPSEHDLSALFADLCNSYAQLICLLDEMTALCDEASSRKMPLHSNPSYRLDCLVAASNLVAARSFVIETHHGIASEARNEITTASSPSAARGSTECRSAKEPPTQLPL